MLAWMDRAVRHGTHALRGGFLVRPLVIAAAFGAVGIALPLIGEKHPEIEAWAARIPVLVPRDATAATDVLIAIVDATMTVISIVLSVLLVAITFAAIQFSPRILVAFVEDVPSQRTIGVFLGTFTYSLFACASAHSVHPATNAAMAAGAICLALVCNVSLVWFIHHIAQALSVGFTTERIARETERIIDEMTSERGPRGAKETGPPRPNVSGPLVRSDRSGYIRFIDTRRLASIARKRGVTVSLSRRVGQFVAEGAPFARLSESPSDSGVDAEIRKAIDLGVARTLEQDVEFGLLQLVDIALRAMSPAVNDPGTAVNCIDQLGRLIIRLASRAPMRTAFADAGGVVRVVLPELPFVRIVGHVFDQIVHYGKGDLAVSLRLQGTFADIVASTSSPDLLRAIRASAERAAALAIAALPESEGHAVAERAAVLHDLPPMGAATAEPSLG
jgi:uncharacterized membrane protein